MSERITDKFLQARIDTVNRLLGNPEGAPYSTVGVVVLSCAYGGVDAHRYCNTSGGVSSLLDYHGTKRELATFLGGMIEGLRAAQETGSEYEAVRQHVEMEMTTNREAGDAHTEADVAADVVERLIRVYNLTGYNRD